MVDEDCKSTTCTKNTTNDKPGVKVQVRGRCSVWLK